ncbi:unnamed protein product, partial [Heterosigma akashiwo]
ADRGAGQRRPPHAVRQLLLAGAAAPRGPHRVLPPAQRAQPARARGAMDPRGLGAL